MSHAIAMLAALLGSASLAGAVDGQAAIVFDRPETKAPDTIAVSSPAFADGQFIPDSYSAYGEGVSPPLVWAGVPAQAKSLALVVEDPDAPSHEPFLHWMAWNIAPDAGGLPKGAGNGAPPDAAGAMVEGGNGNGGRGYFGPKPPDDTPHRYIFQIFALDSRLALAADASRKDLVAGLAGHVLAKGRLTGLYVRPD